MQSSKDVIEGNRLIAEFMYKDDKSYNKERIKEMYFRYDKSWDWLMPVVEKINTLAIDNEGEMGVYIKPNIVMIGENEHHPITMITIANHPTLIEMVWLSVTTFIKWYTTLPTEDNKLK